MCGPLQPLVGALRAALGSGSVQYPSSPMTLIDTGAIGTQFLRKGERPCDAGSNTAATRCRVRLCHSPTRGRARRRRRPRRTCSGTVAGWRIIEVAWYLRLVCERQRVRRGDESAPQVGQVVRMQIQSVRAEQEQLHIGRGSLDFARQEQHVTIVGRENPTAEIFSCRIASRIESPWSRRPDR